MAGVLFNAHGQFVLALYELLSQIEFFCAWCLLFVELRALALLCCGMAKFGDPQNVTIVTTQNDVWPGFIFYMIALLHKPDAQSLLRS